MNSFRAIAAAIVAVCISFSVGSLSANPIEIRIDPDERVAASARILDSFASEESVAVFALPFRVTTFGLELAT